MILFNAVIKEWFNSYLTSESCGLGKAKEKSPSNLACWFLPTLPLGSLCISCRFLWSFSQSVLTVPVCPVMLSCPPKQAFCCSSFPPILKIVNYVPEPALFILAQKIEFYQLGSVSKISMKGLLLVLLSGTPVLFKEKPN